MPDLTHFYRAGKRVVRLLPPWLLRFRPFAIYEILLGGSEEHRVNNAQSRERGEPIACQVRWIPDANAVRDLRPLTSHECVDAWNGTTRRVAAATLDGQPIACAWIATESFEERELGLHFELAPDEAWLFAAVVAPEHRDGGVYRRLLEFLIAELRAAGTRRLLLGVTVGNEPSRRAHARQGAVEVGRITALRSLGVTLCRCTGQVRRLPPALANHDGTIRLAVDQNRS